MTNSIIQFNNAKFQHTEFKPYNTCNYTQCIELITQRILPLVSQHLDQSSNTTPTKINVNHTSINEAIIEHISSKFNITVLKITADISNLIEHYMASANDDQTGDQPTDNISNNNNVLFFKQKQKI